MLSCLEDNLFQKLAKAIVKVHGAGEDGEEGSGRV